MVRQTSLEVILGQAKREKADLIVVGTHGRRGMKRLMLGSVAEAIVRRATCPVFIVKARVRKPFEMITSARRSHPRNRSAVVTRTDGSPYTGSQFMPHTP